MFIICSLIFSLLTIDYWMISIILRLTLFLTLLKYPLSISNISYYLIDKNRFYLIYLRVIIIIIIYFARVIFYFKKFNIQIYILLVNLLGVALVLVFSVKDLINFYLWFERSLIPIFILVYGWGMQPERLEASLYLVCYTLFGSFPLLIFILNINYEINITFILRNFIFFKNLILRYLHIIYIAFLVKIPIFFLHLWLPKVHVEASLSGSIILAAILLKLGAYGLIRFINLRVIKSFYLITFRLVGAAYISFYCLRQTDLKTLVAYSSVVHIRFLIGAGIRECSITSLGSLIIIIRHGLRSSCIFYLVNCYYERRGSRNILINKRMQAFSSIFLIWWFLFRATIISTPFTINFFREIILIVNIIITRKIYLFILILISLFTSCYVFFYAGFLSI